MDPLITELIGGIRTGETDVAPSVANALAAVCSSAGKNIGPAAKTAIVELVEDAFAAGRGGECLLVLYRDPDCEADVRNVQFSNGEDRRRVGQE